MKVTYFCYPVWLNMRFSEAVWDPLGPLWGNLKPFDALQGGDWWTGMECTIRCPDGWKLPHVLQDIALFGVASRKKDIERKIQSIKYKKRKEKLKKWKKEKVRREKIWGWNKIWWFNFLTSTRRLSVQVLHVEARMPMMSNFVSRYLWLIDVGFRSSSAPMRSTVHPAKNCQKKKEKKKNHRKT